MLLEDLLKILATKRPFGGKYEEALAEEHLEPLGAKKHESGNWVIKVGESKSCFTAHLDTVHKEDGVQKIVHDTTSNTVYKDDGEPLGADDAAGVWLLINMIECNVPGLYLFTVGEECGCVGSELIASTYPSMLDGIERVISFDRRGTSDVIVSQLSQECCSAEFAIDLCEKLGMGHKLEQGVFTDSASFMGLVSECTNISVGYYNEHTKEEMLDLGYLGQLKEKVINLDWEALPTNRIPEKIDFWEPYDEVPINMSDSLDLYHEEMGVSEDDLASLVANHPQRVIHFLRYVTLSTYEWNNLFDKGMDDVS